jgi:hypothetical protein
MAIKKQHATIQFQGAATISIGGTTGNSQYLKTASNGLLQWASGTGGVNKVIKDVMWNAAQQSSAGVTFSNDICTITHNLGTTDVIVSAIDKTGWATTATYEQVDMGAWLIVKCPTTATITLHFDSTNAVGSGDYPTFNVTIIG